MTQIAQKRQKIFNDPLRPNYHFLPPQNWMNDPNGLIQWKGKYHLFYQHNPFGATWGNMHWGHAVSEDLVHWDDMPIALAPTDSYDERGVFSGCMVNNDGVPTILYTGTTGEKYETQVVCIATSQDDDLRTWQKYEGNPVLENPPAEFDGCGFRDPYLWRQDGKWMMAIGAGIKNGGEAVLLYQSDDLYNWKYLDPLVVSDAKNDYVYECPNFFPLGDKWVLVVSVMEMVAVEYFVGIFWNNHFIIETHATFADGAIYAPLSFEDERGRRIMIGWITETRSKEELEKAGWAGTMSLPMELMLLENNQLAITLVREVLDGDLTNDKYQQFTDVTREQFINLQNKMQSNQLKIVISDDLSKVIFVDGSVIEYFDFPNYAVRRAYEPAKGLEAIADLLDFPLKRISVWEMSSIW